MLSVMPSNLRSVLLLKNPARLMCVARFERMQNRQHADDMGTITISLKLSLIITDAGTQIRSCIDERTVSEYSEAFLDGAKFPPVVVFHDGSRYILADGFHRVMAAQRAGLIDVAAEIRTGTKSDALRFSLAANAAHGLKRTNADKLRSVSLAVQEWPKLSDRQIAEICAVSNNFVSEHRPQLSSDDSSMKRVGADGKARKAPAKKPTAQATAQPAAQDEEPPRIRTADEELAPNQEDECGKSNQTKTAGGESSPAAGQVWTTSDFDAELAGLLDKWLHIATTSELADHCARGFCDACDSFESRRIKLQKEGK